jgi:hypothetical protein
MWHCSSSPHAVSQSYPRSLVRSFSTQALDHAPHCCLNLDLSFLVSMLQLTGCPPQAFSRTSAVRCNQSHSRLSLLSSALCRHCYHYRYPPRSTELIPIPLVRHHVILRITSLHRCSTILRRFHQEPMPRHLSLSNYPLALILSLFTHIFAVVLYIHVTNRSIQASQEFGP